jgi:outer membrane protein TolC
MMNHRAPHMRAVALVLALSASPLAALSLDEAMNAALDRDSTLADAKGKLVIAKNDLAKSSTIYGSKLAFSGTASGSDATDDVNKSLSASLNVPIAKWLSVGATSSADLTDSNGGSDDSGTSGSSGSQSSDTTKNSVSVTLTPFSLADTAAKSSWDKALVASRSAVRSTMLSVRKEYRAALTSLAEVAYRTAAVQTAQNELSRIQYLVELGQERKSQEINAYSDLVDAQGELDTAEETLASARQALSVRTGIAVADLGELEAIAPDADRTLVDEEAWVALSADMRNAKIALESARSGIRTQTALPDLSVGATVSDSKDWSVTAKVTLTPDLFFQKSRSSATESLSTQERSYANSERSVRNEWQRQTSALAKAEKNYEMAVKFVESAEQTYTETKMLLDRGEAARATLDSASENLLSAQYQRQRSLESLENARDQLDASWQVSYD